MPQFILISIALHVHLRCNAKMQKNNRGKQANTSEQGNQAVCHYGLC